MSDTIFHITGGLGKHVLSTAVINSYKAKFPDKRIIVSSAYPDVFKYNPNVCESLNISNNQYFYKNYIYNKEVEIFAQEPYKQTSHILKKAHIIDSWCNMIGIEKVQPPSLHFNFREVEYVSNLMEQYKNKPILIFQPFGGIPNHLKYSWSRDIHPILAQKIVNKLKDKYNIIHICSHNHPILDNCVRVSDQMTPNILFNMLLHSSRRILIDSCLQHASYALGLKSLVFWNVTSPEQFGYGYHNNIISNFSKFDGNRNSYLFNYEIVGLVDECPFSSYEDIFDENQIMDILENQF